MGLIPLLALEALGSKEMVTRAYLAASILTLFITLNFAGLERLLQRRWVVSLGVGFSLTAITILTFGDGWVMSIAIGLQPARVKCMIVTKNRQPSEIERTKQKLVKYAYRNRFGENPESNNAAPIPIAPTIKAPGIVRICPPLRVVIGEVIFAGRVSCISDLVLLSTELAENY